MGTVASLSSQQSATSASIEELSSPSSSLRAELMDHFAEASSSVSDSNLRIEVVEDRLEGELAAVSSAMALAAAESSASSAALESSVASLSSQQSATSASIEELSTRVAEASVGDTALSALRDELSAQVAEASASSSSRVMDIETRLSSELADV